MTPFKLIPVLTQFGTPATIIKSDNGILQIWSTPPLIVSHIAGYASMDFAREIDRQYRSCYVINEDIVTIHEWSRMTDYDTEARKILQVLNRDMQRKQRELVIHLGKANSLVQKVVRATAETITRFRKQPIELFSEDAAFECRVKELIAKY